MSRPWYCSANSLSRQKFIRQVKLIAEREGVPEKFKAENKVVWNGLVNQNRAMERSKADLIDSEWNTDNRKNRAARDISLSALFLCSEGAFDKPLCVQKRYFFFL